MLATSRKNVGKSGRSNATGGPDLVLHPQHHHRRKRKRRFRIPPEQFRIRADSLPEQLWIGGNRPSGSQEILPSSRPDSRVFRSEDPAFTIVHQLSSERIGLERCVLALGAVQTASANHVSNDRHQVDSSDSPKVPPHSVCLAEF